MFSRVTLLPDDKTPPFPIAAMESPDQPLLLIREQIQHTESNNWFLRRVEGKYRPELQEKMRAIEEQNGRFPPLPPRLPRPQYALTANSLDPDNEESLRFYLACERGITSEVVSFVEKEGDDGRLPAQAVRQYGLEQASFSCKPEVARYLLEKGTVLHSGCFMRSVMNVDGRPSGDVCIFDKATAGGDDDDNDNDNEDSFISLLRAFIEVGFWHPNQAWESPTLRSPHIAICKRRTTSMAGRRRVVEFLLAHGADPNLGTFSENSRTTEKFAVNRESHELLDRSVRQGGRALVELLLRHGARPGRGGLGVLVLSHEWSLSCKHFDYDDDEWRLQLARRFLDEGWVRIDEIQWYQEPPTPVPPRLDPECSDWVDIHRGRVDYSHVYHEDETPLTRACVVSDWRFVEWLLERGADPDALEGKAYKERQRSDGSTYDPSRLRELVGRVRARLDCQHDD